MTAFVAWNCDTSVEVDVDRLGAGAGKMRCPECGGDGQWGKFFPEAVVPDRPCPDCKGTGYVLVSV